MFFKNILTGKNLRSSLFLIKLQAWIKKELNTGFSPGGCFSWWLIMSYLIYVRFEPIIAIVVFIISPTIVRI